MNQRLLLLVCLAGFAIGCMPIRAPIAAVTTPVVQGSPNGERLLEITINDSKVDPTKYLCLELQIRPTAGEASTTQRISTTASSTSKWACDWLDDSTIVLNSRDIGFRAWQVGQDGSVTKLPLPLTGPQQEFAKEILAKKYGS